MNSKIKSAIFRCYIALAREEHFVPSEIGETLEFIAPYSKRLIDEYPIVQFNWSLNEKLRDEVCRGWEITHDEFFKRMIIAKPSRTANLIYSAHLRRVFGAGNLRFTAEFDRDANFILPNPSGFIVPQIENREIISLELASYQSLRKRAA